MIRAFLVDDEPLALARLERLLAATGRVDIIGRETDPEAALAALTALPTTGVDVLFLDIQMPGLTGFELLARLESPPPVVFTTAFDQHALRAFETSSVDYLLKPIVPEQLDRALGKLARLERRVIDKLAAALGGATPTRAPDRIASRLGTRTRLIEVARITHFFAEDKLTYAVIDGKDHVVDASIAELEARLGDAFFRIHRKTLVNLGFVAELDGGTIRLADAAKTELVVARDRVSPLKTALKI